MYDTALKFHFIGIGGTGMSGIAEVLLNCGFQITGSDLVLSDACKRLRQLGAQVFIGHDSENLPSDCSLVVYSSAVNFENPEIKEAQKRKLPIIPRAEVLAELMRLKFAVGVAGAHGKTTTTSMIGTILEEAGMDPTVILGGVIKSMETGGKLGKGRFLVAETDESDRSFLLLNPALAILTNIDSEHMEAYESMQDLIDSFEKFAYSTPFYGLTIFCLDDPEVRRIAENFNRRKITYGFHQDADIRAENIKADRFTMNYDLLVHGKKVANVNLPVPGRHAAQNSLAAIAVALEFKIPISEIVSALGKYAGVERRFDILKQHSPTIINDYGHHPTEVRAVIAAIKEGWTMSGRKLHVVFQPHRYTRTRDCFGQFLSSFEGADSLILLPLYAASEEPIAGINSEALAKAITSPAAVVADFENAKKILQEKVHADDIVLCLGAGTIGKFAKEIAQELDLSNLAIAANE